MSEDQGYLCIFIVRAGLEQSDLDANVEDLKSTFESIGAEVEVIPEPNFDDVKKKITELSEKDFTNYTYVTIAYFALGQVGVVKTADPEKIIRVEADIYEPLTTNPTLDQKLLWLIFSDSRVYNKVDFDAPPRPSKLFFIKLYASVEQSSTTVGEGKKSGLIGSLCRILRGQFRKKDVLNIVSEAAAMAGNEAKEPDVKSQTHVKKNFSAKIYLHGGFKTT